LVFEHPPPPPADVPRVTDLKVILTFILPEAIF
jgi:hypothetical protein